MKKILFLLSSLIFSSPIFADPFTLTFTSTVTDIVNGTTIPLFSNVRNGDALNITLIVDNGGTQPNNQSWQASEVRSIVFTAGTFSRAYSSDEFDSLATSDGTIDTDTTGKITSANITWLVFVDNANIKSWQLIGDTNEEQLLRPAVSDHQANGPWMAAVDPIADISKWQVQSTPTLFGDCDNNGIVDITDVICTINIILDN